MRPFGVERNSTITMEKQSQGLTQIIYQPSNLFSINFIIFSQWNKDGLIPSVKIIPLSLVNFNTSSHIERGM